MLKCEKCGEQTRSGEPTGKFSTYRIKKYIDGCDGREVTGELKVCMKCNGEVLK
jgi:hypothetical protein